MMCGAAYGTLLSFYKFARKQACPAALIKSLGTYSFIKRLIIILSGSFKSILLSLKKIPMIL